MSDESPKKCKDFEVCGNLADEKFTMDFTDVEPGAYIHWCSKCGPIWTAVNEALTDKLENEPGFADILESEINKRVN